MRVYLLTSPFDEQGRTGDGAYAEALSSVEQTDFLRQKDERIKQDAEYAESLHESRLFELEGIFIRWLKEVTGDYHYEHNALVKETIPPNTNPALAGLEIGQSELKMSIGGYVIDQRDAEVVGGGGLLTDLRTKCLKRTTPFTPQVLQLEQNGQRQIEEIFVGGGAHQAKLCIKKADVVRLEQRLQQDLIFKLLMLEEALDRGLEGQVMPLFEEVAPQVENLSWFSFTKKANGLHHQYSKNKGFTEAEAQTFKAQVQASLDRVKKQLGPARTILQEFTDLSHFFAGSIALQSDESETVLKRLAQLSAGYLNVKNLKPYIEPETLAVSRALRECSLSDRQAENTTREKLRAKRVTSVFELSKLKPISYGRNQQIAARKFAEILEIVQNDDDRRQSIYEIIQRINQERAPDEEVILDVHHRPPETGAMIFPSDIELFHQNGIAVHVTVHEYKQNYNRRHLQAYTQALIQAADGVKFFNHKDANNAIHAARVGQLSKEYYVHVEQGGVTPRSQYYQAHSKGLQYQQALEDGAYALPAPCSIKERVSQSPAAMKMAEFSLPSPHEILQKEPNIICFGSIRNDKGFSEALEVAKLIKEQPETYWQETIGRETGPIVYCVGRVENAKLACALFEERYSKETIEANLAVNPLPSDEEAIGPYFIWLLNGLEEAVSRGQLALHNPHLAIHLDVSNQELEAIKQQCKYVLRIDDMGMRYNGSGIINVLSTGVTLAKFGAVTDKIFQPSRGKEKEEDTLRPSFSHRLAVDIGLEKYGLFNQDRHLQPAVKKKEGSRSPEELLSKIVQREQDQIRTGVESENHQTVLAAQRLLQEFKPAAVVSRLIIGYRRASRYFKGLTRPVAQAGDEFFAYFQARNEKQNEATASTFDMNGGRRK